MKLSDEAIAEFQALHLKHFGVELTAAEGEQEALALVRLVAITQPKAHTVHRAVANTTGDETGDTAVEQFAP
jgi:hypothetical protein